MVTSLIQAAPLRILRCFLNAYDAVGSPRMNSRWGRSLNMSLLAELTDNPVGNRSPWCESQAQDPRHMHPYFNGVATRESPDFGSGC